jgi:DNA-binding response OmpR family regulator
MTDKPSIWLLEDDEACRDVILSMLSDRWPVRWFERLAPLEEALRAADAVPTLLMADVCLPDVNLVSWLATPASRSALARVALLVMSALDEEYIVRSAFASGAVDFLSKPFGRAALTVKVERALGGATPTIESPSRFSLDVPAMMARHGDGRQTALTAKEMQIVTLLWNAPRHALSREAISATLWRDTRVGDKTLDVHLSRLRRKLRTLDADVRSSASSEIELVPFVEREETKGL